MQPRHELKIEVSKADFFALKSRLSAVMSLDDNVGEKGYYRIRSLYFDTDSNKALREKLDGLSRREKYRIRFYNDNVEELRLEKKIKTANLGHKRYANLSKAEVDSIIAGETEFLQGRDELLSEFYIKLKYDGFKPKTIVEYDRIPFVYGPGNVRVTLDYNIKSGMWQENLTDLEAPLLKVPNDPVILEVKYDNFLPDVVAKLVATEGRNIMSFSKYAAARSYEIGGLY